jgi:hypothetical protein
MSDSEPSFFARVGLAFSVVFDAGFATRVRRLRLGDAGNQPAAAPPILKETSPEAALQLLGLLQRDGRFIDFIEEDVAGYPDADIGAAARVVHDGCRKVLREHFLLQPIRTEAEGSAVTLEAGFDVSAVRLTGNVVGQPPFRGGLAHRGWRVTEVRLPKLAERHDPSIVAPAEVEL